MKIPLVYFSKVISKPKSGVYILMLLPKCTELRWIENSLIKYLQAVMMGHPLHCERESMKKVLCSQEVMVGFPGGTVVKNLPASAGDTGSSPGPGRSHMPRSN